MGGSDMMNWNQNMWFYMILGFIIFLIFVLILLYYLNRKTHFSDRKYNKNTLPRQKINNEMADTFNRAKEIYCPNCGEKMGNSQPKICPYCGSNIR